MSTSGVTSEQEAISGATINHNEVSLKLFGPDVDGQQMLVALKELQPSQCPLNKKGSNTSLPQSYKKWTSLQPNQLQTVQTFWTGLSPEVQEEVRTAAKCPVALANFAAQSPETRAELTTKHDKVRLLHLYADPGTQRLWVRFRGVKSRSELDSDQSHRLTGEAVDNAGQKLADIFNNRSPDANESVNPFQPQNKAIRYVDGRPKFPNEPSNMELIDPSLMRLLCDLDPNQPVRPMRTAEWIKKQWTSINHNISLIWHDYTKSGLQNGDPSTKEGIANWVHNFASKYTEVEQYSILVLEKWQLDGLGKKQASSACRDSGVTGEDGSSIDFTQKRQSPDAKHEKPGSAQKKCRKFPEDNE